MLNQTHGGSQPGQHYNHMGNLQSTYNSSAMHNKTISTAANTGQNYSLMSQKFKTSMRQNR